MLGITERKVTCHISNRGSEVLLLYVKGVRILEDENKNKVNKRKKALERSSTIRKNALCFRNKSRYVFVSMEGDLFGNGCAFGIYCALFLYSN